MVNGARIRRRFKSLTEAQQHIDQGGDKGVRQIAAQASAQPCGMPIKELFTTWLRHCDGLHKHSRRYQCV
ncbi:MAG: hypothetical protein NTV22_15465, partial [bacterium]|nr:hypothetical protein [bacterium]